jgi:hypothetical protein
MQSQASHSKTLEVSRPHNFVYVNIDMKYRKTNYRYKRIISKPLSINKLCSTTCPTIIFSLDNKHKNLSCYFLILKVGSEWQQIFPLLSDNCLKTSLEIRPTADQSPILNNYGVFHLFSVISTSILLGFSLIQKTNN